MSLGETSPIPVFLYYLVICPLVGLAIFWGRTRYTGEAFTNLLVLVIPIPTSSERSQEAMDCRCRTMTVDCSHANQPRQREFVVLVSALGAEVFGCHAHSPSGMAPPPPSGKESVTTERSYCQCAPVCSSPGPHGRSRKGSGSC